MHNMSRIFAICVRGSQISYFIFQQGFSERYGLDEKYNEHKDMVCVVLDKYDNFRPAPQSNTINVQIIVSDLTEEGDFLYSAFVGRYFMSMPYPPEVQRVYHPGGDHRWGFVPDSTSFPSSLEQTIATRRMVVATPGARSPLLDEIVISSSRSYWAQVWALNKHKLETRLF